MTREPIAIRRLLAGSFGLERIPVRPDPTLRNWHEPPHVRDPRAARGRLASQVAAGADVVVAPTWLTHRRALLPVGETRQARAWTAAAVRIAREGVEVGLEQRAEDAARARQRRAEDPGWARQARAEDPGWGGQMDVDAHVGAPADAWPMDANAGRVPAERDGPADASELEAPVEPMEPAEPEDPAHGPPLPRPQPLVAGVLPPLDDAPDEADGRQLPRAAASERDYHDQAGLLADAEPDLLLIEAPASAGPLRMALEAGADTGLPMWVALTDGMPPRGGTEALIDLVRTAGVDLTLLTAPFVASTDRSVTLTWGGLLTRRLPHGAELVERWLDVGAAAIALLDGATPVALAPVREAIDDLERARIRELDRASTRWRSHVERAAAMAPGGAALWLRPRSGPEGPSHRTAPRIDRSVLDPAEDLPAGFDWLVLDHAEVPQLPDGRFRLVVDPEAGQGSAREVGRLLEDGGILALRLLGPTSTLGTSDARLRLLELDDGAGPLLAILRREG